MSVGRCTCCGEKKHGVAPGPCLACARAGMIAHTPKSCSWCADRQQELDMLRNLKKAPEAPLLGRDQGLLGSGGGR